MSSEEKQEEIEVRPLIPPGLIRQYADHVLINMSPYDITIDFLDIVYINREEVKDSSITRPVKYRVTLPVAVAERLRDMLTDALNYREKMEAKDEKDSTGKKAD
jgi:hypothetical protein